MKKIQTIFDLKNICDVNARLIRAKDGEFVEIYLRLPAGRRELPPLKRKAAKKKKLVKRTKKGKRK